jgi:hypothetical protein
MIVECDGETLPSEMKEMERGRIEAFFIPRRAGVHKISMTFNGVKVPGNNRPSDLIWDSVSSYLLNYFSQL